MDLVAEIEIAAPAPVVWDTLIDFARYSEWNPFFVELAGEPREGAVLRARLGSAEGVEFTQNPLVTRVRAPDELRWRTRLWWAGVLDAEHFVELHPSSAGTRVKNGERIMGWALPYVSGRLTRIARGCVGMNEALKRRVEAPSPGATTR